MAQSSNPHGAHAIVFGASGLIGWGTVEQLLNNYPAQGTFSKVTAVVNRPISITDTYWPQPTPSRPELSLVSGINLTAGGIGDFAKLLKIKVPDIGTVTHAFYWAYKQDNDPKKEVATNLSMLERAVSALNELSPKLRFVVFPSGAKAYGIHIPGGVFKAPFQESMLPLPEAEQTKIHYPPFHKLLAEKSRGKDWTWCDVLPDAIIGFVPNGSAFNLTSHWASYLSTYALVEGKGAKVPFPGLERTYDSLFNEASSTMIARFSIWAALHPEKTGNGEIFNIADEAKASSMRERWPAICRYFGLEGVAPVNDGTDQLKPSEYCKKHESIVEQHGVKPSSVWHADFLDLYGWWRTADGQFSLDKVRSVGFHEEFDPVEGWYKAFDRFKAAGMIPA